MSKKVARTGDSVFFSESNSSFVKKAIDKSFEVTENFAAEPYGVQFSSSATTRQSRDGLVTTSNMSSASTTPIKIYIARYRKFACDWENVIYHGVLQQYENIEEDTWEFLYVNDKYVAYRMFSDTLPTTLPLDGEIPPRNVAPFVRYESFKNIYDKRECKFRYETPILEFTDIAGNDEWELINSSDTECEFRYVKSTPYGCNISTPVNDEIVLSSECECAELSSSSSSSQSSSSGSDSSKSSSSSSLSSSSKSSSLNSSSSEERRSPKNVSRLYLRLIGKPFTENQYVLSLEDPNADSLVWSASSHSSETLTTGTISVTMNYSGRFLLSASVSVGGNSVIISDAVLSNIRNENFASLNSYLKGIAPIQADFITTKYDDVVYYDCVVSHESMRRLNGKNKSVSEIIYDYEMNEMTVDREAEKIVLYLGRAKFDVDTRENDVCRAWGLFCLSNTGDGIWSYSSGTQSLELSQTSGGNWNLNRRYNLTSTNIQEIDIPIDFQDVTNNNSSDYDGFIGLSVARRESISGGVETVSQSDICNDINTLVAFYSNDDCSASSDYIPYNGNLTLTLSGGNWDGKSSYTLYKDLVSNNLAVWNWSSSTGAHEYATLFSPDGILWKLNVGRIVSGGGNSHLYTEFILKNRVSEQFSTYVGKIPKSFVNMNGDWSSSDISIVISES